MCDRGAIAPTRAMAARYPGGVLHAVDSRVPVALAADTVSITVTQDRLGGAWLVHSLAAGLLASVVPHAADLIALRVVPARASAVFMSVHPVMAALVGIVLPGRHLVPHEWAGIAVVVLADAAAVAGRAPTEAAGVRGTGGAAASSRRPALPTAGSPAVLPSSAP